MATAAAAPIRLKSYFASSIPAAIDLARREMGADALLLKSRPSPPEARHLGPIEVVFGDDSQPRRVEVAPPPISTNGTEQDLTLRIENIWNLLVGTTAADSGIDPNERLVEQVLLSAGLTKELAVDIYQTAVRRLSRRPIGDGVVPRRTQDVERRRIVRETVEELKSRFPLKPGIGRVTALVGPPGSGKTTTLVKLALTEGIMKGRPVRLISADTQRIAASEQLRIYASILGVPFQSAENMRVLAQAVDSAPANAILLVDTPGLSPALFEHPGPDLVDFFKQRQDIDVQLVLTASTRQVDLESAVNRFSAFHPSALIFTKLDETDCFGSIFCEAIRTGTPVSYFCDGQLVPENIQPASGERLAELLVRHLPHELRSAA